jgi:transketolase
MTSIRLLPQSEFERVRKAELDPYERLRLIADMCRFNTLSIVKRAGSGHLGSSFSAMDIVVWLYFKEMNTLALGLDSPDRDIYFSSKGHDVPGLYCVLFAAGVLSQDQIIRLRRLGGLDGHPDVGVRGIEANSGSLGMGISKAKGFAWAKRARGHGGRIFVLTGDGELQEGQNYEAMLTARGQGCDSLTVIVDHNKLQTDQLVSEVSDLGDLEAKFRSFGWAVGRCDGHSIPALERTYHQLATVPGPRAIIADTLKGRGVSFMEPDPALQEGGGFYRWHAGAPDDVHFQLGSDELFARLRHSFRTGGLGEPTVVNVDEAARVPTLTERVPLSPPAKREYVADAYGEALVAAGARRRDLVVLDGDLAADCRVRAFAQRYPDRFIENGIAEQDMVSTAGALARSGWLPVVNSFASFLASRANEQIYNNATERSKVVYACHYAGVIPAGPGKSHQSIRDISLFSALPDCVILQPCNAVETKMALDYLIDEAGGVGVLRLAIGPSPRVLSLPAGYQLTPGRGVKIADGADAAMFAYGPVMLHEALVASEILAEEGYGLAVINHPWLNLIDGQWVKNVIEPYRTVFVLEDHGPAGGLGDHLLNTIVSEGLHHGRRFLKFAVEGYPACGAPGEVLRYHGLEGAVLAERIVGSTLAAAAAPAPVGDMRYTLEAPQ